MSWHGMAWRYIMSFAVTCLQRALAVDDSAALCALKLQWQNDDYNEGLVMRRPCCADNNNSINSIRPWQCHRYWFPRDHCLLKLLLKAVEMRGKTTIGYISLNGIACTGWMQTHFFGLFWPKGQMNLICRFRNHRFRASCCSIFDNLWRFGKKTTRTSRVP